jgi:hypothetical protein
MMAVALLVVISLPLSLFLYWKAQQLVVRHEMWERLEQSNLVTIEVPATSVQWYEGENEVLIEGRLFDVKSYTRVPGTYKISFTGLFDEAEEEIEEKVRKLLRQKEMKDGGKKLTQLVWIFFCPFPDSPSLAALSSPPETTFNFHNADYLPIADLSIPAPPPKA